MNPILYDSTETKFDSNGIGVLSDAISCIVTEERNGLFELQMSYPVSGIHYSEIQDRCLITAKPNPIDDPQPFRVYASSAPINGIVTFYARHISYDLLGIPVSPFTAHSAQEAMQKLKSSAVNDCPFTFYTDKDTAATMSVNVPSPIRNLLGGQSGSVLDVYGGEYKFDRYDIWLYQQRGTDRGVNIRYGKNLVDFKQEKNCANVYTGVYPYWTSTEGELLELPEKIVNGPGEYDFSHIMVQDFSQEWQEKPTVEQLRERTNSYIKANNIGVPSVSLTITHAMLEQTEEYKGMALLERLDLCDTASIVFPMYGVSASSKAVKTEFNCLLGRYESVTFGNSETNFVDTVVTQKGDIKQTEETTYSVVGKASSKLNEAIANASGMYTTEEPQPGGSTITYLHDKRTLGESKNVIKITSDAVGVSTDGGKSYPFGLYVNGDLVSRILTAVGIDAEWIRVGILQSRDNGETFFLDLVNGILRMKVTAEALTIAGKTVGEIADDAVNAQTQEDIFNRLTKNGEIKGLYMDEDGQMYLSFSYAKGGELILGGVDNLHGILKIINENGAEAGEWANKGLVLINGLERLGGSKNQAMWVLDQYNSGYTGVGLTSQGMEFVDSSNKATVEETITDPTYRKSWYHSNYIDGYGGLFIAADGNSISFNNGGLDLRSGDSSVMAGLKIMPDYGGYTRFYGDTYSWIMVNYITGVGFSNGGLVFYSDGSCGTGNGSPFHVTGELYVSGSKSRIAETKDYSDRLLYCYEMATPMFGDIGSGETDEDGICYVSLCDVFSETITNVIEYHVFLQKEGAGDLYVAEKTNAYFKVVGTPNLKFSWELKAIQKDFDGTRIEAFDRKKQYETEINYEMEYQEEISALLRERMELYEKT